MEMSSSWGFVKQNILAVEADMVSGQSIVSPKNHLSPKVRVLPTFVHSSVRLEIFLNEMLILVNHGIYLLFIS
jgi:hypothetical protein